MDQHRRARGRCTAHGGRPRRSSSRACRRCRAGRAAGPSPAGPGCEYSATSSTSSATPASRMCCSNFAAGRRAAEQPTLDERVHRDHRPLARAERVSQDDRGPALVAADLERERARGSRTPRRRASAAWSRVSQPGHGRRPAPRRARTAGAARGWLRQRDTNRRRQGYTHAARTGQTGIEPSRHGRGFASGRLGLAAPPRRLSLQQPGRITFDTKFDLTADPGGFLARACTCGTRRLPSGSCRTRPTATCSHRGRSSSLGELAGVPDWVVQRLWSALLLIVAYEGTRLSPGRSGCRRSPGAGAGWRTRSRRGCSARSGVLTGEVAAERGAAVGGAAAGPRPAGRLGPRQAGCWSRVRRALHERRERGGHPRRRCRCCPRRRSTQLRAAATGAGWPAGGWLGMAAACAWWMVPLLLLGRYSPPFLDFIETAGRHHLPDRLVQRPPRCRPLARLLRDRRPALVARRPTRSHRCRADRGERAGRGRGPGRPAPPRHAAARPPLAAALLGLLCLTAATRHASARSSTARCATCSTARSPRSATCTRSTRSCGCRWPSARPRRRAAAAPAAPRAPDRAPVARCSPWWPWSSRRRPPAHRRPADARVPRGPGGLGRRPRDYLDEQADSRALVLPGSGFGLQTWGWTIDEPLQGVADSAWVTRSQVPLVPGPTARYLDTDRASDRLRRGRRGAGRPARPRRHQPRRASPRPRPAGDRDGPVRPRGDRAGRFPGLEQVAGFGRSGFGDQPMIEVYRGRPRVSGSLADRRRRSVASTARPTTC